MSGTRGKHGTGAPVEGKASWVGKYPARQPGGHPVNMPRPTQHILEQVNSMANAVARSVQQRGLKLRIAWISRHDWVEGNDAADAEAKKASTAARKVSCPHICVLDSYRAL
jgi:hypothetical protein